MRRRWRADCNGAAGRAPGSFMGIHVAGGFSEMERTERARERVRGKGEEGGGGSAEQEVCLSPANTTQNTDALERRIGTHSKLHRTEHVFPNVKRLPRVQSDHGFSR